MARRSRKTVSVSSLRTFLRCPAQYFFQYYSGAAKKTDYPRLCGVKVHNFIKRMEVGNKRAPRERWSTRRRFYYSDFEAAVRSWRNEWRIGVETATNEGRLLNPNSTDTFRFAALGAKCLENYWRSLEPYTPPTIVEKGYNYPWLDSGITLVGNIDQVRAENLDYIRAKRPELFRGGQLHPDFDPVVILDFKTGWDSFGGEEKVEMVSIEDTVKELYEKNPDNEVIAKVWFHYQLTGEWPKEWRKYLSKKQELRSKTPQELMQSQFSLAFDIQATAYSWLYFKHTGKWPVGFRFYYLRTNAAYFTSRDGFPDDEELGKHSVADLNVAIEHLIDCENSESYPPNIGQACKGCDYTTLCLGRNEFTIAPAEQISGPALPTSTLEIAVQKPAAKQLRLKLKVERVKKGNVPEILARKPIIRIQRDLPWREELDIPKERVPDEEEEIIDELEF